MKYFLPVFALLLLASPVAHAEKPAIEADCPGRNLGPFLAGDYKLLGHQPAGAGKGDLFAGQAEIAADGCRLIVRRCDSAGRKSSGELVKSEITADRLTVWLYKDGDRQYMFESESTNGNYAVLHGSFTAGTDDRAGHEFWYVDEGALPLMHACRQPR